MMYNDDLCIIPQRRTGSDVDFYRDWVDYKNGFGDTGGDFWLGNDAIHKLTVRVSKITAVRSKVRILVATFL